ncbi:MAG: carboxypeptidase regulatory-like domain-containing protein [bacterium]
MKRFNWLLFILVWLTGGYLQGNNLAIGAEVGDKEKDFHSLKVSSMSTKSLSTATIMLSNEYIEVAIRENGNFTMGTKKGDPDNSADDNKKLLFGHPSPWSGATTIRIDGNDYWNYDPNIIGTITKPPYNSGSSNITAWDISGIIATQTLILVNNPYTGREDIVEIKYTLRNATASSHNVGVRVMLDTKLGDNDGALIKVPESGTIYYEREFTGENVPIYWQAYENLATYTTRARGILRNELITSPDRFVVADWHHINNAPWEFTPNVTLLIDDDSAVGIYWNPGTISPSETKEFITYYGVDKTGSLTTPLRSDISAPVEVIPPGSFSITLYLENSVPDIIGTVTGISAILNLPDGLELEIGSSTQQYPDLPREKGAYAQWSVKATGEKAGTLTYSFFVSMTSHGSMTVKNTIYVYDLTPPTTPIVIDDGTYTTNNTQLHAIWRSEDLQSGIAEYQYGIGTIPGAIDTVGWTSVGTATECTATGLTLNNGQRYYFVVKARNLTGDWSESGTSNGITVDTTPPVGTPTTPTDIGVYSTSTTITFTWTQGNATDTESSIAGYYLQVGIYPNGNDKFDKDVGDVLSKTITNCQHSYTYYARVRAKNGAGLYGSYSSSSDGITIDTTPPEILKVTDDGTYTTDHTSLHATWVGTDTESGIVEYQYAIGTTSGGTEIATWTSTGTNTEITLTGLSLATEQTYYFAVRAKNGAGVWSGTKTSDGIKVENVIIFIDDPYEVNIERDYNQLKTLTVKNIGTKTSNLRVEIPNPYEDIILNFIGDGSEDNPEFPLVPGESKDVILDIHAQDAATSTYQFTARIVTTREPSTTTDTAKLTINVRQPNINCAIEIGAAATHTLITEVRVTNNGDTLTDVEIILGDTLTNSVVLQPNMEHGNLRNGDSFNFSAIPLLGQFVGQQPDFEGAITVNACKKPVATKTLQFKSNWSVWKVELKDRMLIAKTSDWYCINRPVITTHFQLPSGFDIVDITKANLTINFTPKSYCKNHNVYIYINDMSVGTLTETVPTGEHNFSINPSILQIPGDGVPGVSDNTIKLVTEALNSGSYLVTSDFTLHLCIGTVTIYVCAPTYEEAKAIAEDNPYFIPQPSTVEVTVSKETVTLGESVTITADLKCPQCEGLPVTAYFSTGEEPLSFNDIGGGKYEAKWIPTQLGEKVEATTCTITVKVGACENWVGSYKITLLPSEELILVMKYAPVLYLHNEEIYSPNPVKWIDNHAFIREFKSDKLLGPASATTIGNYSESTYLDFYNSVDFPSPMIYARVTSDEYQGKEKAVIQYWFFWSYNDFQEFPNNVFDHEGDWEMIEIIFDSILPDAKPEFVVCAQHKTKERKKWSELTDFINETHLPIYIAKGCHGSYFTPGEHTLTLEHAWEGLEEEIYIFLVTAGVGVGIAKVTARAVVHFTIWGLKIGLPVSTILTSVLKIVLKLLDVYESIKLALAEVINDKINFHISLILLKDFTTDNGKILYPSNLFPSQSYKMELMNSQNWIQYPGRWGEIDYSIKELGLIREHNSGPLGPKYQGEKWEHPIEWARKYGIGKTLAISIASPAQLHLFDIEGRHLGLNQNTDEFDFEIPNSFYLSPSEAVHELAMICDPATNSTFKIQLWGTETGHYELSIRTINANGEIGSEQILEGTITSGLVLVTEVKVIDSTEGTITVGPVSPLIPLALPNPPANLQTTPLSDTQINIRWQDNSPNEDGFEIERKIIPLGTYALIATVGSNTITYIDSGLIPNTTYSYRMRAFNIFGTSNYSNEATATTFLSLYTGTMTGTVINSFDGTPIPNAFIEVLPQGTSIVVGSTTTSSDGIYILSVLEGTYTVKISAKDYKPQSRENIGVKVEEINTINFSLIPISKTLNDVIIYPNPCKPHLPGHDKIIFDNLTSACKIQIYNIAGEIVYEKEFTDTQGKEEWYLRNQSGKEVSTGVYFYVITNPAGEKVVDKLAIIR